MREQDVPQDEGVFGGLKEVCYAVSDDGNYRLVPSAGWEPKIIANDQAWELLTQQFEAVRRRVLEGELSPLAFHMAKNQMDVPLLAQYTGLFRWRVKRHLRPKIFAKLGKPLLERYAAVFQIDVAKLSDPEYIRQDQLRPSRQTA